MLELKEAGALDKIMDEIQYQRSTGYLQGVPIITAIDQVGNAMINAGALESISSPQPQANVGQIRPIRQPVSRGIRKAQEPKNPAPNPALSSTPTQPSSAPETTGLGAYDGMSDEEFRKLPIPI